MKRNRKAFVKVFKRLSWFLLISGLGLILACRSWSQIRVPGLGRDSPLPHETENLKVRDVCTTSGWDWSTIPFDFPPEIKASVQAVPTPIFARNGDKLAWKFSPKGGFDARSAYLLASDYQDTFTFDGTWIWKLSTLPKIQMFMWKCLHQAIGVIDCLAARGMQLNGSCPMCHEANESILHALRDCNVVKLTWHHLGAQSNNPNFFLQGINEWLNSNTKPKRLSSSNHPPWNVLFPFAIWLIWNQRNQAVFKGKGANPHLVKSIIMQATEYALCISRPKGNQARMIRQIRWEKPDTGWVKLNTNGSASDLLNAAGCGGLIRDEQGNWIGGFLRHIGNTNSFIAEVWALRDGLQLCHQLNLQSVMVELDASAVVDALNNPAFANTILSPLFDDCKHLIALFPQCHIRHIFREANSCADKLSRLGLFQSVNFVLLSSPPVDLIPLIEADRCGLYSDRIGTDVASAL